jgi:hypothetical protein
MSDAPGAATIDRSEAIDGPEESGVLAAGSGDAFDGWGLPLRMASSHGWGILMLFWALALAAGFLGLTAYANRPGEAGPSPRDWPWDCVIPLDGRRPTLVMFLHPLCPWSRASIDELAEVIARTKDRVAVNAVLLRAHSLENEGVDLNGLPSITSWDDNDGTLARRFGVLTSGHVLLYDPGGRLLYSGGITASRGHRGENLGRSALLAAILGAARDSGRIPVFGCPLFEPRKTRTELPRR